MLILLEAVSSVLDVSTWVCPNMTTVSDALGKVTVRLAVCDVRNVVVVPLLAVDGSNTILRSAPVLA